MIRQVRTPRERTVLWILNGPATFWLIVFFMLPLGVILVYSFLTRGTYGGLVWEFQLNNYVRFADPLYLNIFRDSFVIAAVTTLLCFLIGYPMAYWLSRQPAWLQGGLMLLIMIPFWTNFLVRTYAWKVILAREGILNSLLLNLGLINQPMSILFTRKAVYIGLVYAWVVDMVLPCYASLVGLDESLIEAAQDLYANRVQVFLRVILPLSMPGIVSGSILVFVPSLGAYIIPDLLGGGKSDMIGNLIDQQFRAAQDWPFGSAISFVLMVVMLIGTVLYFRMILNRSAEA